MRKKSFSIVFAFALLATADSGVNKSMKILLKLTFLILIISIIACNKAEVNDPLEHFGKLNTRRLNPSSVIDLEQFDILHPVGVAKQYDKYYFRERNNENIFTEIDFLTKEKISGVNIGNGPEEILSIGAFQTRDNKILVYDINKKTIFQITQNKHSKLTIESFHKINYEKELFILSYANNAIIASGIFENCWLSYLNLEDELLSYLDFPNFAEMEHLPDLQKSILFLSTHTSISPNGKKMVAATQSLGAISFCEITSSNKLAAQKEVKYFPPIFTVKDRGTIAYDKKSKIGFCALDSDNKYVYALYSGRTFEKAGMESHHCEHLLVYNWNGVPVKYYHLEIPLYSMKYDKAKNSIYGIGYNPEGVFIEYKL